MKYILIFIISISACFADYEIIEAEYLDSIDNRKLNFYWKPFFYNENFIFINKGYNIYSDKRTTDLFIMNDFKINVFEGRNIIKEIVDKEPYAFLESISDMVIDSKNNIWMLTSDCLLIKYDWNEFKIIDELRNEKLAGNSLAIDDDDNIYIHTNRAVLTKFDGNKFTVLNPEKLQTNLSLHFLEYEILKKIGNKIFYISLYGNISYYDIKSQNYDTLDIKSLLGVSSLHLQNYLKWKDKLIISYGIPDSLNDGLHLASYDGDKFTNLDYILKLIPHDFNKSVGRIHIDDVGRYYFTVIDPDSVNYSRIYQIDTNMQVRTINFYNNNKSQTSKNMAATNGAYILKGGTIIIPELFGGFIVIKEPSSVETPLNVLFVNKVYPNPARQNVSIDFIVEPENLPNISVELYNLTGILQSKLDYNVDYNDSNGQGTLNCNIENIPNGYYIIVIDNGKRKEAKPFIVNKD